MSDNLQIKGGLEEAVLAALVYNEECAAELLLMITPAMFSDSGFQSIAQAAFDHLHKYNKPPGRHIIDIFADQTRRQDASGKAYRDQFVRLDEIAQHLQAQYILDQLETFIETSRVRNVLNAAKVALDNQDLDGAKLALAHEDVQIAFDHGTWLHKPEEMLSFLNQTEDDFYSSGIVELDNRGVRPSRATIMVLMAPPKRGKSWYLINQAKNNLARRKSVLHITCENSAKLTAKRYIQALYAMSTYQLSNVRLPFFDRDADASGSVSLTFKVLDDDPIIIDETQRRPLTDKLRLLEKRPRLLIKEFASGTLTVPMIVAYLNVLEREGFKPDLLIVDYPKMMKLDTRNYRLDLGRILIELRGLAVTRDIAVSTVMQGSKRAATAHVVSSTMTAEDYSVVGTADTILTYSQTPEEKRIGLARILVDSARDAPDAYIVMISQSYATGQFCLDSVFMTTHLESEAEQLTGGRTKPEDDTDEDEDEQGPHL